VSEADCFAQPRTAPSFGQWGWGRPVRPYLDPPLIFVTFAMYRYATAYYIWANLTVGLTNVHPLATSPQWGNYTVCGRFTDTVPAVHRLQSACSAPTPTYRRRDSSSSRLRRQRLCPSAKLKSTHPKVSPRVLIRAHTGSLA